MRTLFQDLARVGMAQALEAAGENVTWVFPDGERPITALVSEENVVERMVAGQKTLVKSRGLTFSEDNMQKLFALVKPARTHRFRVYDHGGYVEYAVHETISRAGGGTTILGDRVERRETVKEGFHGTG